MSIWRSATGSGLSTLHDMGGADHIADTLANINTKVSDATLDDSGDPRDPNSHALAGAEHSADTLANLNSKVSDATLIDTGDSRLSDSRKGDNTFDNVATARTNLDVYDKGEVDVLVDATLKPPEAYDPTITGNYPLTYGGEAIQEGDSFRITANETGIGDGVRDVNIEDLLIAITDSPSATVNTDWMVAESNRDQATETVKGVAELATQAETDTGTNDTNIVTPLKLATSSLLHASRLVEIPITQASHTLVQGDPIYNNAGTWTLAQSDVAGTVARYIVTEDVDTNTFKMSRDGILTWTSHGLTLNVDYYVSDSVAGDLTSTEPSNPSYSNPVLMPIDANTVLINVERSIQALF